MTKQRLQMLKAKWEYHYQEAVRTKDDKLLRRAEKYLAIINKELI